MFKKFIVALATLIAATAFAAVDANKGTQAELEAVKGIGPVISTLIVNERKKGDFKDWNDMVVRVKGVGDKNAGKFSEGGLTVNGATFTGAPMKAPAKTEAPVTAKAASAVKAAASASTGAVEKAASATKATASKAASAVKGGASTVASNAREEKDALKENVKDAKEKRAEKKAEKAEKKPAAASTATK